MRYCWLMPLFAVVVMTQTPEEMLARKLDHEAQFQLRFSRRESAHQKLQIAEWLSPHPNRQTFLLTHPQPKGNSHDPH